MDQPVLVAILVFLLIAQAVMLASSGRPGEREIVAQRLTSYIAPAWEGALPRSISVLRRRRYSRLPWLDLVLAQLDLADGLSRQLQKAGLPITKQIPTTAADVNFVPIINPLARADAQMIKEKQNDPNVVIVDARTPQEHFQARIPGSLLHNWEEGLGDYGKMIKDKNKLERDLEEQGITKDKEVICYCHSGMRASHKYLQLKQAGFDNVRMYDGSIIDWAQRRNPLR